MITINWKLFLKASGVFLLCVILITSVQKYINNQTSKKMQEVYERNAKTVAEIQLKCETEKLDQETELKKRIVDLEIELEKSKILIDKIQKQTKVTEQIKKDVRAFIKEFDALVGTKGKSNEK
jgi:ABC-type bacteriocin/lantibiotic exporter with double-glycine peptidase domain